MPDSLSQMLEKSEEVTNNGLSTDTGKIGHKSHRTKTNKIKNSTQKTRMMSNTIG